MVTKIERIHPAAVRCNYSTVRKIPLCQMQKCIFSLDSQKYVEIFNKFALLEKDGPRYLKHLLAQWTSYSTYYVIPLM